MIARVPATSANLGPGFDALGMAVTLWAEVGLVTESECSLPVGAHLADDHALATIAFARGGGRGRLWVRSPIPMGRGLGYSAAMRVAGLLLAAAQRSVLPTSGRDGGGHVDGDDVLARCGDEILAEAVVLEGHGDNAAPALLGGVVASTGERVLRVPLRFDPAVVVWVPDESTNTDRSRASLGELVPRADAVFNLGRVAYLVAALASGDVNALRHATHDRLHQPQRFAARPRSAAAHRAALDAGAWCAWLSGSGPSAAALCAVDMADDLAARLPADGHTKVLRIDHVGATLEV